MSEVALHEKNTDACKKNELSANTVDKGIANFGKRYSWEFVSDFIINNTAEKQLKKFLHHGITPSKT